MSSGEAKVDEFDIGVLGSGFEQDILRLDVAMDDSVHVQIVNCLKDRLDDASGLIFGEATVVPGVVHDTVEELASRVLLCDDVDVVGIFVAVHHFHDSGMVHFLQEGDLTAKVVKPTDFCLLDGFDGERVAGSFVYAFANAAIVTAADDVWEDVIVGADVRVVAGDGAELVLVMERRGGTTSGRRCS